jgi:hypothetical protein
MCDSTMFAIKAGNNDITLRVTTVAPLALAGSVSSTTRLEPQLYLQNVPAYYTRQPVQLFGVKFSQSAT